ncbi:GntR family transcriptional regulator [Nocardia sp. NPDC050378]|uniref:FadR/GntR family transcriptional regulator n=1 Tax=Nocardia sp. NPDC050378 TaxID=3155400 RepID=UPI00340529D8
MNLNGRTPLRAAESVAADLRDRILRAGIPDGPLPKQEDLMGEYQVSGPSIREALRILESEGLITVRRGRFGGAFVHRPSWSTAAFALGLSLQGQNVTLSDLAESLAFFEPQCAIACAQRPDRMSTVVSDLAQNIEETERALGDGASFTGVARSFHEILVDWTPNAATRLVVRSMVAVWSIQEQAWAEGLQVDGKYPDSSRQCTALETHRKILRLVEKGDGMMAAALMATHLAATQELVLADRGNRVIDSTSPLAARAFRKL